MKKFLKVTGFSAFVAICAALFFGVTGEAYIDPSVMTYLIQAIAGIVIAVGAAVGIYFRRAKKKINDKLGIDENAKKEVESDQIMIDDAADAAVADEKAE